MAQNMQVGPCIPVGMQLYKAVALRSRASSSTARPLCTSPHTRCSASTGRDLGSRRGDAGGCQDVAVLTFAPRARCAQCAHTLAASEGTFLLTIGTLDGLVHRKGCCETQGPNALRLRASAPPPLPPPPPHLRRCRLRRRRRRLHCRQFENYWQIKRRHASRAAFEPVVEYRTKSVRNACDASCEDFAPAT